MEQGKPAVVLVPSRLLLAQWEKEARQELSVLDPAILLAGGSNDKWRHHSLLRLFTEPNGDARLTIATIQTACTRDFRNRVNGGDHLLLVADEVHRLGAPEVRKALTIAAGARLGLSATPDRYGDAEGTAAIRDYFGETLDPVITLAAAISLGRLCKYKYFPHVVQLDEDEVAEWKTRTQQMVAARVYWTAHPEDKDAYERYKLLLIQRARVAKQAAAKTGAACLIVAEGYESRGHWLVYCDDTGQLNEVVHQLRAADLPVLEYHSAMEGSAEATLDRFGREGGILVAIKCLDEGVDIPTVSHAVILASSRNPREFIQRRGRVLRRAPGKRIAVVHDLLVEPPDEDGASAFDGLVQGEIARAAVFARDADNPSAFTTLMELCARWGVDIEQLAASGMEGDSIDGESGEE